MTDLDLSRLTGRGLSVLRKEPGDWYDLEASRGDGARFSLVFSSEEVRKLSARAPALIILLGGELNKDRYFFEDDLKREPQLKLGWTSSIQKVATRQSRVSFDHVMNLTPSKIAELVGSDVPSHFKNSAALLVGSRTELGALTSRFGDWVLNRIASLPGNRDALHRLTALVDLPKRFDSPLAVQHDALRLALRAFGAPAAAAEQLEFGPRTTALASVRAQENLVIEHDARWIPGWTLANSDVTGRAVFEQGGDKLEVFTANREDLERVFGVDLIYLNQPRRSIVMVQYKMLEPMPRRKRQVSGIFNPYTTTEEQEWVVPIDKQFVKELARMNAFEQPADEVTRSYRMSSSPFFFKFVRRLASTNSAGIMMSLGHLRQLRKAGSLAGPRDGLRIVYSELQGHYLRSESFVELVRSGYIGSHEATTEHLQSMIEATLSGGRSVVAAIQRALPSERSPGRLWS